MVTHSGYNSRSLGFYIKSHDGQYVLKAINRYDIETLPTTLHRVAKSARKLKTKWERWETSGEFKLPAWKEGRDAVHETAPSDNGLAQDANTGTLSKAAKFAKQCAFHSGSHARRVKDYEFKQKIAADGLEAEHEIAQKLKDLESQKCAARLCNVESCAGQVHVASQRTT